MPKRNKQNIEPCLPEYYQLPFEFLHRRYLKNLSRVVRQTRSEIKKKYEAKISTGVNQILTGDEAFTLLRSFLDELEEAIRLIATKHSPFFWLHLYRRIGLGHISEAFEKSDASTLAAVRRTVESAIFKHSDINNLHDMSLSDKIAPTEVLDGLFFEIQSLMGHSEDDINKLWEKYHNQWVLSDYKREDHQAIYTLEGYAYEYWRAMANMRAIAKGATLHVSASGKWRGDRSEELDRLIQIYDRRLARGQSYFSSAKGLLSFNSFESNPDAPMKNRILFASYNYNQVPLSKFSDQVTFLRGESTNFVPMMLDGESFLRAHKIMTKPFLKKWGFSLENVILFLSTLSAYVLGIKIQDSPTADFGLVQFLQRAYIQVNMSNDLLINTLLDTAKKFSDLSNEESNSFSEEIGKIFQHFQLSFDNQSRASLWSLGPRPLIVPHGETNIIDIGGLQLVLENLFFSLRENQQQRGYEFETILRAETEKRGFELLPNRILRFSDDEYRETDLAIKVDNTLVLCDCRSIERPLDLFLGKPSTQQYRTELLQKKNDQVNSIKKFVNDNPIGTNYNFSWAERIVSIGVLPDTEWIWSEEEDYWIDIHREVPIILSVEELFKELKWIERSNVKK